MNNIASWMPLRLCFGNSSFDGSKQWCYLEDDLQSNAKHAGKIYCKHILYNLVGGIAELTPFLRDMDSCHFLCTRFSAPFNV